MSSPNSRKRSGKKDLTKNGPVSNKARNTTAAEERRARKEKLEQEKADKQAATEKNNIFKPGECMKHMAIEMHPVMVNAWYMADVGREAAAAGCRVASEPGLCDPALVMWARTLRPTLTVTNHQVGMSTTERCSQSLYVREASEVAELVQQRRLSQTVAYLRDVTGSQLTLVVFGVKDYFKESNRKTKNSKPRLITEIDFEMALTDVLVSADCSSVCVDTPNQLALLIVQYTKAIAEMPFKLAKRASDEQADFYMRGDKKDAVVMDEQGNGVSRLWQQMIAILPNSSLEVARSLCAQYNTPLKLCEALNQPDGVKELASMAVSRAAAPEARGRRLGPEFARKLQMLFTGQEGDTVID